MTSSPTWSIILPTFNRDQLAPEAIRSVLEQTVVDWELIVVDDGSENGTHALESFCRSDVRIHYVRQDHAGRSVARNRGFSLAGGEFICFLDSDDRYLSTALATHADAFDSGGRIGLTIGGYQYIDEAGAVVGERRPWTECDVLTPEAWLFNCFAMPGSVVVRREWFERAGGFDFGVETRRGLGSVPPACLRGVPDDLGARPRLPAAASPGQLDQRRIAAPRRIAPRARQALPVSRAARRGCRPRGSTKAWTYAASARSAASLGLDELVGENLRAAAELDALPRWERRGLSLSPQGFPNLVEGLLADVIARDGTAATDVSDLLAELPSRWNIARVEVRRGLARVEMSRFFDALASRSESRGVKASPQRAAAR